MTEGGKVGFIGVSRKTIRVQAVIASSSSAASLTSRKVAQ